MLLLYRNRRVILSYGWICRSCQKRLVSSAVSQSSNLRKLPVGPARTRFAPSPTGYLHIGSLRTALFNYLLAKSTGGEFILRIEDTDQKRTIPGAEDQLCRDLEWAGLEWDEGPRIGGPYGPYRQSERTKLYQKHANELLQSGHAYRCFCSPSQLNAVAKHQDELGLPSGYDRTCFHVSKEESNDRAAKGEAHVIRLKAPLDYPQFTDLIYGQVRNRSDESRRSETVIQAFEDPVLVKSDGFPTYHLANVVDDHHMGITHVVRATEWMSSTPKHIAIYEAFQWDPPAFAHVSMLTNQNRQKLSKRNMDLNISTFRNDMGIFPETLTNFVALLGWSHRRSSDVMNLKELIENFTMKFTVGDTIVTFDKMWYLQKAHAERYANTDAAKMCLMTKPIMDILKKRSLTDDRNLVLNLYSSEAYLPKLLRVDARNYTNAAAFVDRNKYLFETPDASVLLSSHPSFTPRGIPTTMLELAKSSDLSRVLSFLANIPAEEWTAESIRMCINTTISKMAEEILGNTRGSNPENDTTTRAVKKSCARLIHGYIRWAVSAGMSGPEGADVMDILGRDETLKRFENAANIHRGTNINWVEAPKDLKVEAASI